ncbi:MAG: 3'(2'),5'-bisphosphate nucleotidase CysQ [Alphaproteobacteria bacterium]|nr:3'(2'),5'-bisphosphate nucleotidase CysQ [Alphaproteobacteria bacterium]
MNRNTVDLNLKLLDQIILVARQAGNLIMDYYKFPQRCTIYTKSDSSPVTKADQEAEELIIRNLKNITPEIPVIAEEIAEQKKLPVLRSYHHYFWLVDPLDGTRDFIQRSGEFTVNIGLVCNQEAVLGVIYAPLRETIYAAIRPLNLVFREESTLKRITIKTRSRERTQAKILNSKRQHPLSIMPMLPPDLTFTEHEFVSSSLKFCLIAEGQADFYPRRTQIMEWDTAAGQAILEAAGGHIRQIDGSPLLYRKENFINPAFVAYGNFI